MTGNTHFSLGVAAGAAAVAFNGTADDVGACVAAVMVSSLGSLLPDIDEDGSMLNNLLFRSIKYRSAALSVLGAITALLGIVNGLDLWIILAGIYAMVVAFIPHRSFTHSLLSLGIVSGITYLAAPDYVLPMAAGYLSHLLADAITSAGIPIFWPWKKRIGTKNLGFSVRSGDTFDKVTGKVGMYGGCLAMIYMLLNGASYDDFFQTAREQLETVKGLFKS
ncbi:metal-dependent hydrolase [Salinithrix halophila]|uniref:Metal-dependent hydrolase n=1 Tax=Salinithrix halophila TaxID=1485204 RepID=A0ABV8JA42_9BACL